MTKTADKQSVNAAGELVEYTIEIRNTGNQTLFDVEVIDSKISLSTVIPTLSPTDPPVVLVENYTVLQSDIDGLLIENIATVTAQDQKGTPVQDTDIWDISVVRNAGISLVKTADVSVVDQAGDLINYTIEVENTGNLTLSSVTVVDPKLGLLENPGSLAPGLTVSYTAQYTVTQSDIDTGFIDNLAGSFGFTPFRQPIFATDSVRVGVNQQGSIDLKKSVDKAVYSVLGEVLTYTFVVTNTGNLTLDPVILDDSTIPFNQNLGTLQPGESATATANYSITQQDLDRGLVRNEARVEGQGPSFVIYSDIDRALSRVDANPAISITKTANVQEFSTLGEQIIYTLIVENIGNLTLSDVLAADPLANISGLLGTLSPGEVKSVTGTYNVQQKDLNAGQIRNDAAASGVGPRGQTVTDDTNLTLPGVQTPEILLEKTADKTIVSVLGESISYRLDVRNTGNVTLDNVILTDPLTNLSDNIGSLDPNAGNVRTSTHQVTQAELDAGFVINVATAVGIDPSSVSVESQSSVTVPVDQQPKLTLVKSSDKSTYQTEGEVVQYTLDVSNSGNVTLSDVIVTDPLTGLDQNIGTLIPGQSAQVRSNYTITLTDINSGQVSNIATVVGKDPSSDPVRATDDLIITANQIPQLDLQKDALVGDFSAAGDVIDYTLTVSNTGNVSLYNVIVTDPLTGTNQAIATLNPGISQIISTSYTVNQVDMDAGVVNNTATASGTDPGGQTLQAQSSESVIGIIIGEITVTKTADLGEFSQEGEVITYSFELENTGNVTLFSVDFADPILNLVVPIGQMAPGDIQIRTATYTVTQQDIDEGGKVNLVLAEGFDPKFDFVFDLDVLIIPAIQTPALEITKTALTADYDAPGDILEYTLEVENTGNVTLLNVEVIDPLTSTDVTVGDLSPGQATTLTTVYTVTQADIDAGSVTNTATAEGTDPLSTIISDTDDAVVNAIQTPGIALTKTPNPTTYDTVGEVISYTFEITNTGNVTLDPVELNDPLGGINSQMVGSLAPGDVQTLTGSYTITQTDIDAGLFVNQATATGTDPNQIDQIATAIATVTAIQSPDLSISKTANPVTYSNTGDQIQYEFIISNPGNVTLDQVILDDPLVQIAGQNLGTLAPSESKTVTATYLIIQQDLDRGSVPNTATVTALDPTQNQLNRQASFTVNAIQSPSISLEKTSNVNSFDSVNDLIGYQLVATNTGNVTLDQVTFNDPIAGIVNDVQGSLAPGQTATVTGSYLVLQSDLNPGERENNATVTAVDPNTAIVEAMDDLIVPADVLAAITLDKNALQQTYSVEGETITYTLTVTNIGNVSLSNISLLDPLVATPAIPISDLDPGDSEVVTVTYDITQADLDGGSVTNTATVNATDPKSNALMETATEIIAASQNPSILIDKTADKVNYQSVNEVITYTLTVENTGNLTLTDVVVTDDLTNFTSPSTTLIPGATVVYTTTYSITQADLDAGSLTNLATVNANSSATPVSDTDDYRLVALVSPSIDLVKTANPILATNKGEVITYTFVVSNVGNVTLSNAVLDDPRIPFNTNLGILAPGDISTTTATYTLSQDDINNRIIENVATVSATAPDASPVVASDRALVLTQDQSAIQLSKSAITRTYDAAGDNIEYEIVVTNIGNITLTNVLVNDPLTSTYPQ